MHLYISNSNEAVTRKMLKENDRKDYQRVCSDQDRAFAVVLFPIKGLKKVLSIIFHKQLVLVNDGPGFYRGLFFNMKMILTILFFADTMLLAVLTYWLLKIIDSGEHGWPVVALLSGITASILLLIFFFYRYLKLPARKS